MKYRQRDNPGWIRLVFAELGVIALGSGMIWLAFDGWRDQWIDTRFGIMTPADSPLGFWFHILLVGMVGICLLAFAILIPIGIVRDMASERDFQRRERARPRFEDEANRLVAGEDHQRQPVHVRAESSHRSREP